MTDKEALIILKQRAELQWSDPKVVFHFIEHLCRYSSRPQRQQACSTKPIGFAPKDPLMAEFADIDFSEEIPTLVDAHQPMSILDDYSEVGQR